MAPVRTTGTHGSRRFSYRYSPVSARVSVPWSTTMPAPASFPRRRQRPVRPRRHAVGGQPGQGHEVAGTAEAAEHLGGGEADLPVGVRRGATEKGVVPRPDAGGERLVDGTGVHSGPL